MANKRSRVIVITGASAGVGRAVTREFAKRGDRLGLIARGQEKLDNAAEEVRMLGGEAITCAIDVSDPKAVEAAVERIERKLGPIDIWINNAMVTMIGEIKDLSPEEIKRVMEVNYLGSVHGILSAYKKFRERGRGHIIQIGSALAYISIPLQSAYCASKHAVHGFIQSLRIELKINKSKIKLTEVHLPAVNTPQFEWMRNHMDKHPMPVPPIFAPEVIARAVAFVADHPRREMWVGGSTVKAILGQKFATWIAEWKLARSGVEDQQTDKFPLKVEDNMWGPVDVDYGASGVFDDVEKKRSLELWASMHRKSLLAAGLLAGGLGFYQWHRSRA